LALRVANRFIRSDSGSFTLETSLVYPTVLLIVFSIVFFSLFLYQKVSLYHTAAAAAERSAYSWDNSGKDWETGNVAPQRNDGLYWRTGSDGISGMFAFGASGGVRRIELPAGSADEAGAGLPERKLYKAAEELPQQVKGTITYRHGIVDREVTARLGQSGVLPFLASKWTRSWMETEISSVVTEPVELIRNVDFVRTFVVRVKDMISKPKAEQTVPAPTENVTKKLAFGRAEEAAEYIRSITGGVKITVSPPSGRRQLDALDADGLVHEVKLGYTSKSKDIESQIIKDLELMRSGSQVKGVVWHFFRKEKDGKIGPSKPLRQELEKRGILVVIHQ
jgi:hypothetical protein